MYKIILIGVPPGDQLGETERMAADDCGCIVASDRYRKLAAELCGDVVSLTPIADAFAVIDERLAEANVAVLASGDPLFFGIGRTLFKRYGSDRLRIIPAVSSMQYACARFKEMWDDATLLSFHGRKAERVAAKVMAHDKVFCLTDRTNSPSMVARAVLDACTGIADDQLATGYTVWVAENLGQDDERITCGSLSEISGKTFADLNVMLLKKPERAAASAIAFGLQEEEISHSRGLITKSEVRAATLHQLRLPKSGVLWDVGAGSGSVGLEAARLCPDLQVFAIERKPEELKNIRANCREFAVYNLTVVEGEAPASLAGLPDPDRVFVGGSGGNLAEIVNHAASLLPKSGRLVVNGVIEKTKTEAPPLMHAAGLKVTISEIAVQRRSFPENSKKNMNSIAIMVGEK